MYLKFRPKISVIIISIYLPHNYSERKIAVKSLNNFIRKFKQFHIIIAGDFNTYPLNSPAINAPTTKKKQLIYNIISDWVDTADIANALHNYTHITLTSVSRIDQIWLTRSLAGKLLDYKVSDSEDIISDHMSVQIILDWFEYKPLKTFTNHSIYDWKNTSPKQIDSFVHEIDLKCSQLKPSWSNFNHTITSALNNNITKTKHRRPRQNLLPKEITKITHAIKNTKKARSKIKNNKPTKLFGLAATWNNKLNQGIISLPSLNKLLKVMIIEKIHKLSLHNSEQIYYTLIENV